MQRLQTCERPLSGPRWVGWVVGLALLPLGNVGDEARHVALDDLLADLLEERVGDVDSGLAKRVADDAPDLFVLDEPVELEPLGGEARHVAPALLAEPVLKMDIAVEQAVGVEPRKLDLQYVVLAVGQVMEVAVVQLAPRLCRHSEHLAHHGVVTHGYTPLDPPEIWQVGHSTLSEFSWRR